MATKEIIKQALQKLISAKQIPENATGEMVITVNVSQGGFNNAKIGFTQSVK